jgi:hypothetical protein
MIDLLIIREKKSLGPAYQPELAAEFKMCVGTIPLASFFCWVGKRQDMEFIYTGDSV